MSIFKITESKVSKESSKSLFFFDIELIEGNLVLGDQFRLYETHRPVDFTVTSVRKTAGAVRIHVDKTIPWDGLWVGAIVDTETPAASLKYGYNG